MWYSLEILEDNKKSDQWKYADVKIHKKSYPIPHGFRMEYSTIPRNDKTDFRQI